MKIAIVSPYPPSEVTLNEYGYHLIKHLARKEEVGEIVVLTNHLPDNSAYSSEHRKVRLVPCWSFNSWKNPVSILNQVKHEKPDVVLFNLQFLLFADKKVPAALGLMTPMLLKWKGYHTVTLLHNILEQVDLGSAGFTDNKLLQKIYQLIGNTLTTMILQSDVVGVTIEKYVEVLRNKYKKDNIALIPHGTFDIPKMPSFDKLDKKESLKVMTFGKFGTYKKVEILIEAVEKLRQKRDLNIEVVIAGTDSPNVPGYLAGVQETYRHVPDLTFTGYVPEEDVERIFKESTVVVFPYTSTTGSSGVLHQAGSYGKAAVLPRLGDLERLMDSEGYCGSYFEPESVESLANALEMVLTDEEYRHALGVKNYRASTSLGMSDIADWYLIHFGVSHAA
ncbi:glycosyltransferase [Fulvivirga sp. M361]|nr:glycosyltransferase [Fulvivirga sp. M361]